MYKKARLFIVSILYKIPFTKQYAYRRLPRHHAGYKEYWVHQGGAHYRSATLKRDQDISAMRRYPSPEELRNRIAVYSPSNVLDVGCGYGKYLEILKPHFSVEGCDVSQELLRNVRSDLQSSVFCLDIVHPPAGWITEHRKHWDVVFSWCVMMYFIDQRAEMMHAMKHMEAIANKKVLVWEWKHVCDYMKSVYPSDKFEYHYIPVTAAA